MFTKLFVGGLPFVYTDEELKALFSSVGTVVSAIMVPDPAKKRTRGFGFVEMSTPHEAQAALEQINGQKVGEKNVYVTEARENPKSTKRAPESKPKPNYSGDSWRPARRDEGRPGRPPGRSSFGDRGPRFGDRPRRDFGPGRGGSSFGDRRPRRDFSGGPSGNRGPRRDFGPGRGGSSFGDRGPRRPSFGDRRPSFGGPRKDFSSGRPGSSFGDRRPRSPGSFGDRPRAGGFSGERSRGPFIERHGPSRRGPGRGPSRGPSRGPGRGHSDFRPGGPPSRRGSPTGGPPKAGFWKKFDKKQPE